MRTAVRILAGAGLMGATALGLAAPAAAEEQPVDFAVGVLEAAGWPGDTAELYVYVENTGIHDLQGFSADLTVPDGVTITGIVGREFADGTERPDEVELADDAAGVLGPATYTVTADQGGTETA